MLKKVNPPEEKSVTLAQIFDARPCWITEGGDQTRSVGYYRIVKLFRECCGEIDFDSGKLTLTALKKLLDDGKIGNNEYVWVKKEFGL